MEKTFQINVAQMKKVLLFKKDTKKVQQMSYLVKTAQLPNLIIYLHSWSL